MDEIKEYLPMLIPIVVIQLSLLVYVLVHILKHDHYKTGSRALWLAVVLIGMNFVGPVIYLIFGRDEE